MVSRRSIRFLVICEVSGSMEGSVRLDLGGTLTDMENCSRNMDKIN